MKKLYCLILSILMMGVLCLPAFGTPAVPSDKIVLNADEELLSVAFMELDQASAEMASRIIAAREEIIYSHSWVADGLQGWVFDRDGNIVEEVPEFSDLFPAEWASTSVDVDVLSAQTLAAPVEVLAPTSSRSIMYFYNGTLTLSSPSATVTTPAFCSFSTTGWSGYTHYNITYVCTSAVCQVGDLLPHTYNVGYMNATTGQSLGWKMGLADDESFSITTPSGIEVAVRASMDNASSATSGDWYVQVYGYMDILND